MPEDEFIEIHIKVRKVHAGIFRIFIPFFGTDVGEVIYSLAIRWFEEHLGTPQINELLSRLETK